MSKQRPDYTAWSPFCRQNRKIIRDNGQTTITHRVHADILAKVPEHVCRHLEVSHDLMAATAIAKAIRGHHDYAIKMAGRADGISGTNAVGERVEDITGADFFGSAVYWGAWEESAHTASRTVRIHTGEPDYLGRQSKAAQRA